MTETLGNWYSSESTRRELSNEYQFDRVKMIFKKSLHLCALDDISLSIGELIVCYMLCFPPHHIPALHCSYPARFITVPDPRGTTGMEGLILCYMPCFPPHHIPALHCSYPARFITVPDPRSTHGPTGDAASPAKLGSTLSEKCAIPSGPLG